MAQQECCLLNSVLRPALCIIYMTQRARNNKIHRLPVQTQGPDAASPESAPLPYAPAVAAAPAPELRAAPAAAPPLPAATEASAEAEQPVSAVNGQLVGVDSKPLSIRGVNWRAHSLLENNERIQGCCLHAQKGSWLLHCYIIRAAWP